MEILKDEQRCSLSWTLPKIEKGRQWRKLLTLLDVFGMYVGVVFEDENRSADGGAQP